MPRRAWLLALGAIAVRAAASFTVAVIQSDGARNLRIAELIEGGRFAEALLVGTHPPPPLHPLLTVLLNIGVGNLHVAGVAVSVVLGGLALALPAVRKAEPSDDPRAPSAELPAPGSPAPVQEPVPEAEAPDRILDDAVGPAAGAPTVGLGEAVAMALQGNYGLLQASDSLSSSRYRYSAALAQFYPKLTPSYQRSAENATMNVEARQLVPWTGGSVSASANYRSVPGLATPLSRNTALNVTVSQPLLRGFGPNASLYDLRNSRRDMLLVSLAGPATNFMLMLVSAFGGFEAVMTAYHAAVERRYRFYSYGDAMLLL